MEREPDRARARECDVDEKKKGHPHRPSASSSLCTSLSFSFFPSNVLVDVHLVALVRRLVLPVGVPPVGIEKEEGERGEGQNDGTKKALSHGETIEFVFSFPFVSLAPFYARFFFFFFFS